MICVLAHWVVVRQPNTWFTPWNVLLLPVPVGTVELCLLTQPALVCWEEFETSLDVVEYCIRTVWILFILFQRE